MTASSGGPIVQDKVHYYAGFERTYRDMTNTFNLTPELVASVGQPPQPNTVPAYQSVRFFLGKIDYQVAQGHRLTTRVNWFENNNPYNGGAGGTTTIERGFDYKDAMSSTAAQLVSNWGSNRLNELRTQYAAAPLPPPVARGGPEGISVNITNAISFGHPTSDGEDFVQGITQVLDNFTLIRGRHSFKTGLRLPVRARHARRAADRRSTRSRRSRPTRRPRPARRRAATRRSRRSSATRTSR